MAGSEGDASSANKLTRPTNADVARLVGVSTATVSYVLNEAEGKKISRRTREAVYRAAEQLGYRPNLAARNLARGKSGVVLYIVPRVAVGEMPMQAGSRMTTELAGRGLLQVQIFETEDDQHVIDAIKNIDPVAIASLFPLSAKVLDMVRSAAIPHIEIGALPALGDPHLSVGELRVEHLASRGHQRIAFAYTGIKRWRPLGDYWLQGVTRAAEARGLPPVQVADVTQDNAAQVVTDWVRDGVTAVCAQSDEIACLVLYGIREAGLRCPDDLAVMGVDATPMAALSSPPLTTVEFNPVAVADAAIAALVSELGYPAPPAPEPADIARLIVRAST
ncbi:LacI family transcriptional regulator [Mycobacterium intermedium]|uniref:LacI family transcriptional regulator n=1 Tax=Mycobacterium intermedium TaxID=28445 RepID=A0A1E3SB47_MYCIE|nr:LacI family DNA-binding transcriptional regulator [Mycobacterium intermedium]MCV6967469.1 LacI family DNA-binding transcriptional regulator [Mycobacterium intermedium]ODQ99314.1 LacI family transcriptional regulator [Mycobacterium intermedium]OPE49981.1 LacI family transcriptional regulator [Mycobacterium intermedium]ORB07772.1 LacI family transcriptional regulator [Mycobacterium intermedium]